MTKKYLGAGLFFLFVVGLVVIRLYGADLLALIKNRNLLVGEASVAFDPRMFRGFVLFVDLDVDGCSTCFSEINSFEKIRQVYPDLPYAVVIKETGEDPAYYSQWIKDHVHAQFNSPLWIDRNLRFQHHYGFGSGSKVLYFNAEGALTFVMPLADVESGRRYLDIHKTWFQP